VGLIGEVHRIRAGMQCNNAILGNLPKKRAAASVFSVT
jgi:hypothetical protein